MSILYIAVGIPGCGKSTYGRTMNNVKIVCPDSVRRQLYGSESVQGDGNKVFSIAYAQATEYLKADYDVYFDATSVTKRARKECISKLKDFCTEIVAIVFDVPYSKCLERNAKRARHVPAFVMERMHRNFSIPTESEGFCRVVIMKEA